MSVLETARKGYAVGLSLLPACEDGTKKPDVSTWLSFKTTRPSIAQMRQWNFAHRCGLGVIAGPVSQHVECWDFDDADTFTAFVETAAATDLLDVVQRIRLGYEDRTLSGGVRWLVRYPESVAWNDCTLARRPGRGGEPAVKTLIELPTFSIIAPSNGGVHPSGRPYVHVSGDLTVIANYEPEERASLLQLARSFDQMPRPEPRSREHTTGKRPGDHYNRRTTWQDVLLPAGWCEICSRGETTYWRRPNKAHGISATTNHAGSDCLYVFSSSTEFAPDTSYTKFGAYAVLQHDGNHARAARALAADGYVDTAENAAVLPDLPDVPPSPASPSRLVRLTPVSEIPIRPVRWLWKDRLSLGTLSLLGGREGVGKSALIYTLAADLTRGRLPGVYLEQPRSVLVAATEDSYEHTIGPRLMAAQADRTRVFRVEVETPDHAPLLLSLPQDVAGLEQAVRDTDAALIILDPLLSRLDERLDTHVDADVRRALEPIAAMANTVNVTICGLIHVNKSASSDALNLLMASRAFPAVARNVLFVMTDPDDESHRMVGQAKNNLGRTDVPMLVFAIENTLVATTPEGPIWTGQLRWLAPSDRTLRDAIELAGAKTGDRTAAQAAAIWLEDFLTSEGDTAAVETIVQRGRKAGHSRSSLYLAKLALNLTSDFRGFPRTSYWVLPPSSRRGNPGTTECAGTTGSDEAPDVPRIPVQGIPNARTVEAQPPVVPPLGTRGAGTTGDTVDLPDRPADVQHLENSDRIGSSNDEEPDDVGNV